VTETATEPTTEPTDEPIETDEDLPEPAPEPEPDPTFTVLVTYAAGHTEVIRNPTGVQVEAGLGAYARDMAHLRGDGITRVEAYIDTVTPTPRVDTLGNSVEVG
jgi:hypothetical protein